MLRPFLGLEGRGEGGSVSFDAWERVRLWKGHGRTELLRLQRCLVLGMDFGGLLDLPVAMLLGIWLCLLMARLGVATRHAQWSISCASHGLEGQSAMRLCEQQAR